MRKQSNNDNVREFEEEKYINSSENELSMKLPIKLHFEKLELYLSDLMSELEKDKGSLDNIKKELDMSSKKYTQIFNDLSQNIISNSAVITQNLRKMMNIENEESNFLKLQANQLSQDKIKLQQNTIVLENKIIEVEKDIGFKNVYDHLMSK